ncbi:uncharacterized protein LOC142634574 [Castanea sativa]|uniref:uncharacterized protein LOC142634574 n=1 Tax=Castanea sativa TaxID=21020 RepID=UPI003F6504E3
MTNRSLLKIIKTQFERAKGAWPEELPNVLWAYRMITRVPTGGIPFKLTFGTKAIILVEVGLMILRVKTYKGQKNQLNNNLDLIDEVREKAMKQRAKHKEAMARYYNRKVKVKRVLVSNNGKQFDNDAFKDFCQQLGIQNQYSSPGHPQANGQVEAMN